MEAYMYEEEMLMGLVSGLISGVPSMLLSIAAYVLTAMALYTMAKRRGLNKPWLAWIPVVSCWVLGSLSDQYRYVVKGENKTKRKILLTLSIVMSCLCVVMIVVAGVMVVNIVLAAMGDMDEMAIMSAVMGPAMGVAGLAIPMVGVAIAYAIIYYMALYDVYKSMDPGNCVLFLVLSIIFNITEPFFLFFNRNKDLGMPPRRSAPSYTPPLEDAWQQPETPVWQPQEPVQEPVWQAPELVQQPAQEPAWKPQEPVEDPWENTNNKDYL